MVVDKLGNVLTDNEFLGMKINEGQVDIRNTEAVSKRIDTLILKLEQSKECRLAYRKLNEYLRLIKERLGDNDSKIVMNLDDCFTEILIMFEEFFYVQGYKDGARSELVVKKLASCLNRHSFES
jgi:hypothetical protein